MPTPAPSPSNAGIRLAELSEKIKELVRLAQEQGHLTYNDINEVLPDSVATPEMLDEVFPKLRSLEIEIVDQAEVDHVKTPEAEEEDTTGWTRWTIRCGCISSRWARWRC